MQLIPLSPVMEDNSDYGNWMLSQVELVAVASSAWDSYAAKYTMSLYF